MYKIFMLMWILGTFSFSTAMAADIDGNEATIPVVEADSELPANKDPFEKFNRAMFAINEALDRTLLGPLAHMYQDGVPDVIKDRISNVLNNIKEPWTLINDLLQGETDKSLETFSRLLVNTVFGLCGLFDVAGALGLDGHQSGFGQTLAVWGVPSGPYIFLPIIGPQTVRSLVGKITGLFMDPYNIALSKAHRDDVLWGTVLIDGLVQRADSIPIIDDLRENSLDYYTGMRSSYLQYDHGKTVHGESSQANTMEPDPSEFF